MSSQRLRELKNYLESEIDAAQGRIVSLGGSRFAMDDIGMKKAYKQTLEKLETLYPSLRDRQIASQD